MPHSRKRLILALLKKKLSFFPVVAIQGARQTGKSFLARELLAPHLKQSAYVTFDDEAVRSVAEESAKLFLRENGDARPLIIDEAQKVPKIFDALKFSVDQKRIPGKFLILGSTEFSRQALIREALTGRMGKIRLYPLNLEETGGLNLLKYLQQGGLPGIAFVRDASQRAALLQDWVEISCYRDLQQFKKLKLDGELAVNILELCSTLSEPTQAEISRALQVNHRKVGTHLEALQQLFVINRLSPHPSGTGKAIYLPFDCGVAAHLGAKRDRLLQVWLLNELLVRDSCENEKHSKFYYYRSTGKKVIHLVEEGAKSGVTAHQFISHDTLKKTDSELMKAFLVKNPKAKGAVFAPIETRLRLNEITYHPWESAMNWRSDR